MANLAESAEWIDGIYQLETEDEVKGGADGISNLQAKQLAKRTSYLKAQVETKAAADHNHDADYSPLGHDHAGTYATPAYVQSLATPTGAVLMWPLGAEPAGFLPCEGAAISRVDYADLFAVIGTTYGDGNGSTTFNLPDYRGYFLRGFDNGAGVDPDAADRSDRGDGTDGDAVGTAQAAQTNNVSSFTTTNEGDGSTGAVEVPDDGSISAALKTGRSLDGNDVTLQLQTSGAETRPKNKSVLFIIKY